MWEDKREGNGETRLYPPPHACGIDRHICIYASTPASARPVLFSPPPYSAHTPPTTHTHTPLHLYSSTPLISSTSSPPLVHHSSTGRYNMKPDLTSTEMCTSTTACADQVHPAFGKKERLVTTPMVLSTARTEFNCPELAGTCCACALRCVCVCCAVRVLCGACTVRAVPLCKSVWPILRHEYGC